MCPRCVAAAEEPELSQLTLCQGKADTAPALWLRVLFATRGGAQPLSTFQLIPPAPLGRVHEAEIRPGQIYAVI